MSRERIPIVLFTRDIYRDAIVARIGKATDVELRIVDDEAELAGALDQAQVLIASGAGSRFSAQTANILRSCAPKLRWVHTTSAGNDGIARHGLPEHVQLTGGGGHSAANVAEHALALLLGIAHCLPDFVANKAQARWDRSFKPRFSVLSGKNATVLGFGPIGQTIARHLRALGLYVTAVTRSGRPDELADATLPVTRLDHALAMSEILAIAAPLSSETRGLIGAAQLRALGDSGYLVNVGRGAIVDSEALADALEQGTIRGAAIDVTVPEPLPPDDRLWRAPNLIISPHTAGGGGRASVERMADSVEANLELFRAGLALRNPVTLYP
ncbi:D-2-hydroxyacid dehydrogenase [Sphingosinicella terrae]|uniref:D-2-hydroxyacid dehydrogenase n=1 Tax=Sphingosinicella terrae TaxID=2172047 RepID=UPI000E0D6EE0|nr:D-2-hydroxyacid dehydrogenase [Sphingosinicella terrae]